MNICSEKSLIFIFPCLEWHILIVWGYWVSVELLSQKLLSSISKLFVNECILKCILSISILLMNLVSSIFCKVFVCHRILTISHNIFHCGILVPWGSLTSVLLMVLLLPLGLTPIKLTVAVCCSLILLSTWISLTYLCLWRKCTFILLKIKSMGRNEFLLRLICKSFCGQTKGFLNAFCDRRALRASPSLYTDPSVSSVFL